MPVLHLLAGPNGAGKSTFWDLVLEPVLHLPFINADRIATERWPGHEPDKAYEGAQLAAAEREAALQGGRSFATETVFSHRSKLELIERAKRLGYLVTLHALLIPEELAVRRVEMRVRSGGHSVPECKVRSRYRRLWVLVREALALVDQAFAYDNARAATPFATVARYEHGQPVGEPAWPAWTPRALLR